MKSIKKNYFYNLIYQIFSIIMPVITTPYLSRVLGAENIGIYSYTLSITTYFILFGSLGIGMYAQREIAYVQNDVEKRSKLFYEMFLMKLFTLSISMIAFFFVFCTNGQYNVYYKILLLEIIANIFDISWFFQGLEEFKKTVSKNMIVRLISVVMIFLLIKSKNDLMIYIIIYVLTTLFGNLSLWISLPKFIKKIKFKKLNMFVHLKPTLILFIPQIATQIYTVLDKVMIGAIIIDKAEVGFYEQSQKVIKILLSLATSLGTVMMPRIASIYAKGDLEKIKDYMFKSFAFICMLTFPLMFGIVSVSESFVPLFFGNGYEKVSSLLCIISPIIVLIGFSNVIGTQYLLPTKQQGKYTLSVIIGAIINFILNLLLIGKFKSIGASIGTVFAELCVTVTQLILVRDFFKINDIIKTIYKYIIASIIMFCVSLIIKQIINNNFISIILQVSISSCLYFSLLLLLFKDKYLCETLNTLKNKFKRIKTKE